MRYNLSENEKNYRRFTKRYYALGGPHPLKAPDQIKIKILKMENRIKKSKPVTLGEMRQVLKYALLKKRKWILNLKKEESYLRSRGWKTEPFEHKEFLGDHDAWISPNTKDQMSRSGAMSEQCNRDGHSRLKNKSDRLGICCRCGSLLTIQRKKERKIWKLSNNLRR